MEMGRGMGVEHGKRKIVGSSRNVTKVHFGIKSARTSTTGS